MTSLPHNDLEKKLTLKLSKKLHMTLRDQAFVQEVSIAAMVRGILEKEFKNVMDQYVDMSKEEDK